jgi:hypothetical protein
MPRVAEAGPDRPFRVEWWAEVAADSAHPASALCPVLRRLAQNGVCAPERAPVAPRSGRIRADLGGRSLGRRPFRNACWTDASGLIKGTGPAGLEPATPGFWRQAAFPPSVPPARPYARQSPVTRPVCRGLATVRDRSLVSAASFQARRRQGRAMPRPLAPPRHLGGAQRAR